MTLETEVVAFCRGTLTTLCWAPQAIKILRSRDGRSISLITQMVFVTGAPSGCLWRTARLDLDRYLQRDHDRAECPDHSAQAALRRRRRRQRALTLFAEDGAEDTLMSLW